MAVFFLKSFSKRCFHYLFFDMLVKANNSKIGAASKAGVFGNTRHTTSRIVIGKHDEHKRLIRCARFVFFVLYKYFETASLRLQEALANVMCKRCKRCQLFKKLATLAGYFVAIE
jgi:hypothetical protein